jgi:HEAT repeat protein
MSATLDDEDSEIAALREALDHADPDIRRLAVAQSADLAHDAPALFAHASRDPNAGVRLEAVRALEGEGAAEAVAALADRLEDSDPDVASAAAESLGEILDSHAGPILLQRLDHAYGAAKAALLAALRKLRLPAAATPAIAALGDPSPAVRREAVGVLAYLRDDQAVSALSDRAVHDPDTEVRRAAIGGLRFAAERALPAVLHGLRDSDWQNREEAAVTLAKLNLPDATDGLIAALDDSYWQVRVKAAVALGSLQASSAVPALIATLAHPLTNVRKEAANALGAIGDPEAAVALRALLQDSDIEVRKAAARALTALDGTA